MYLFNKLFHKISFYIRHKSLYTSFLIWMILVRNGISLCWHVHWAIVIFLYKQYLMMAETSSTILNQITLTDMW